MLTKSALWISLSLAAIISALPLTVYSYELRPVERATKITRKSLVQEKLSKKVEELSKLKESEKEKNAKANAKYGKADVQVGFESEYGLAESLKIFENYEPTEKFVKKLGVTKKAWSLMTQDQQLAWAKEALRVRKPHDLSPILQVRKGEAQKGLPEYAYIDDTGNIEVQIGPFNTFEEFKNVITSINDRLGVGSMQAMVSTKRSAFFEDGNQKVVNERLGWLNFVAEFDILERMFQGHVKAQTDADSEVIRPMLHPYLGPTTKEKREYLARLLPRNAVGEKFDEKTLEKVRYYVNYIKYVGTTAYRPDIGGNERVSFEIRDKHKSTKGILAGVARAFNYLENRPENYSKFAEVPGFDPYHVDPATRDINYNVQDSDYGKIDADTRAQLEVAFPVDKATVAKRFPKTPEMPKNPEAVYPYFETFRNFAFPLRDWNPLVNALGRTDLVPQIEKAQASYVLAINEIGKEFADKVIDKAQARIAFQRAMAKFAADSKLYEAMDQWQNKRMQ